ncbi:putative carboxylesterase 18 [Carex littledalei]|uniref:Putative carboxylesterase 18 n=1 Tax=Carex littledalei TaxID=544730 RepID=A0A833VIA8_9POAL|nr:putative carboxylesterase 18 [Carex littledalei]
MKWPQIPWTERLLLSLFTRLRDFTCHRNGTVNRRLLPFLDLYTAANPNPVEGVCTSDVTIDSSCNLYVRMFVPSDPSIQGRSIPVIVYFHGGGFSFFSASSPPYDALCRRISREICAVVVSVNYRLAPEHKYPAAYDDGSISRSNIVAAIFWWRGENRI